MKTDLYNTNAEKIGQVTLPANVFGVEFSDLLVSQSIRNFLSNRRSAHAKVKNRAEVAGTTRKMWAQKGTGRARHGSAKAPIFVGGGRAHGPRGNQNYQLKSNRSSIKVAIRSLLSSFVKDKKLLLVDKISQINPKTKDGFKFLLKLNLKPESRIGILTSLPKDNVTKAFKNIPGLTLLNLQSLNVYQLSCQNFLIISQAAVKKLAKLK